MAKVVPMTSTQEPAAGHGTPAERRRGLAEVRAARAPTPAACGCGLPVAFDVERHEFFCTGCGSAKQCVCRRSRLTSVVRPVNVV